MTPSGKSTRWGSRPSLTLLRTAASVLALAVSLVAILPRPASAHPDRPAAAGDFSIPAGAAIDFPIELHFHRLVGDFAVTTAGGSVSVLVVEEAAFVRYARGARAVGRYVAENASLGKVNALIACCVGTSWSKYRVVLENDDPARPVTLRLRMVLIHDGFAVFVYDAETGAAPGAIGVMALLAAAIAWPLASLLRRPARAGRAGRRPPWAFRAAIALFATPSLASVALAAAGAAAFGGGAIDGFVASAAFAQFLSAPFAFSLDGLLDLILFLLWAASLLLWARAVSGAERGRAAEEARFGLVAGGVALVLGVLVAATYGTALVPALVTAMTATPLIAGGLLLLPPRA